MSGIVFVLQGAHDRPSTVEVREERPSVMRCGRHMVDLVRQAAPTFTKLGMTAHVIILYRVIAQNSD